MKITGCSVVDVAADRVSVSDLHVTAGEIGSASDASPDALLDGSGLYAIPGLIDMHVHMTSDPHGRAAPRWSDITATTMTISAIDNLATALKNGVTTVRDLGAPGDLGYTVRAAWRRSLFVGARPVVAGPVITSVRGHGSWMGVVSEGIRDVEALVRHNVANGSEVIKLMMASADRPIELRPEEVAAAIEEAHWQGLPVAVHANFSQRSIDTAVGAGCDTLEHGFQVSSDTAAQMAAQGTALCGTTFVLESIAGSAERWRRLKGTALVERAVAQLASARESFERALDAGVAMLAGTDAGVTSIGFDALPHELATMVRWGATPTQALAAATTEAARALRRPDLGHLDRGAIADIVLLRENPLNDVSAVTKIEAVMQGGVLVRLDSPSRLSGSAATSAPGTLFPEESATPAQPRR